MVEDEKRLAVDDHSKESPENSPPYLEIKRQAGGTQITENALGSLIQGKADNPDKGADFGSSLPLGEEYEKKKQKLQEELRLDYKFYLAEKKSLKVETTPQSQNLSLPIKDRNSAKERLRDERNKEYNHFLKDKAGLKRIAKQTPSQSPQVQTSDAFCISSPTSPVPVPEARPHREHLPSRRDASTLTEAQRAGTRRGAWGKEHTKRRLRDFHRAKELLEPWERRPRRGKGRLVEFSSDEEFRTDQEEFLEFIRGRRRDRPRQEPKDTKRRERRTQPHRDDSPPIIRAPQDTNEVEGVGVHYPVNRNLKSQSAVLNLQMPDNTRTAERSRSPAIKDISQFATGLMIGTVEDTAACQERKERYRQELLEQIAEQKTNKTKEKKLELRVAATGAIDPEKKPDRIKQFGAVNREPEPWRRDVPYRPEYKPSVNSDKRGPTGNPNVAFPSPTMLDYRPNPPQLAARTVSGLGGQAEMGVPGVSTFNENYHRGLSSTLGEIMTPRLAGIPPPVAPALTFAYKTPYDDVYQYYGARNPLDPNLPNYGFPFGRDQPLTVLPNEPQGAPRLGPEDDSGAMYPAMYRHAAPPIATTVLPEQRPKQSKVSYHEELQQQMREMQQRKNAEREQKERENARFYAEMLAYDPWGRGGAGAPIKDQSGNVVCDLKLMHKTNEKVLTNPEPREKREGQCKMPGPSVLPAPLVLGKGLQDRPSSQQRHRQETYRDFLLQQMEEKRQKQEEQRERIRLEEEREEKILAKQRAYLQQEHDEERERFFRKEEKVLEAKKTVSQQAEERHRNEERRRKEASEREHKLPQQRIAGERPQNQEQRGPSPPVPALLKKLSKSWVKNPADETPRHPENPRATRPPTADSLSSRTFSVRSMSASTPQSPPVPAGRTQLRAKEERQALMGQLSALRRHLRIEQKRLASQLGRVNPEEPDIPPLTRRKGPLKGDVFDLARLHAARGVTRRGQSDEEHANMQNIRQFNHLKSRDSPSRQEVRQAFPDPPSDELSLDLQQQALLRDQQRQIRNMRRKNDLDSQHLHHAPTYSLTCHSQKYPVLVSESTFMGYDSGNVAPEAGDKQKSPPEDRKTPAWLKENPPKAERPVAQRDDDSLADSRSESRVNIERVLARNESRIRRLASLTDEHQHASAEGLSGDEGDSRSLCSTPSVSWRRVSVDTVATEPWLRPGTSEAVKRPSRRERPASRLPTH